MAEFPIDVKINPNGAIRGGQRVRRELQSINNQANRLRDTLSTAFSFVGITIGIQQLTQLTDAVTVLQNRIRSITDDQQELAAATQEVFDIATRVRAPVREIATLYARISVAASELGTNQAEVSRFVELTGQALATQGTAGQEASGALLQLSQAIGGTVIQAQEFNSLIDGARPLLEAVAAGSDRFGGSVNALRTAVRNGTVTSKEFFEAALEGSDLIAERFGRATITIGQAFTNLRNETLRFIEGSPVIQRAIGAITDAIIALSENVDTLARIGLIGGVFLTLATAIGVATLALKAFVTLLAANPVGAFILGLTTAVTTLVAFADRIKLAEDSIVTLQDIGIAAFELVSDAVESVAKTFEDEFGFIADFVSDIVGEVNISLESILVTTARIVDGIIGFWTGLFNEIKNIFGAIAESAIDFLNDIIRTYELRLNTLIAGVNAAAKAVGGEALFEQINFGRVENKFRGAGEVIAGGLGEGFRRGLEFSGAEDALNVLFERAEQVANERVKREEQRQRDLAEGRAKLNIIETPTATGLDPDFRILLENLREQQRVLGLANQEREIEVGLLSAKEELNRDLIQSERQLLDIELRSLQAAEDRAAVLDRLQEPTERLVRTQDALNALLREGEITAEQYGQTLRNAQLNALQGATDFSSGFQRGFLQLQQSVGDFSTLAETALTGAFDGATDAIIQFVTTGQANFRQFAASILADIARIALRQAILGGISAAFGGFGGGLGGIAAGAAAGAGSTTVQTASGKQMGGQFTVGGSGGIDSQLVAFRASPGERVSVDTKHRQQKEAQNRQAGANQQSQNGTQIVNVLDPSLVGDFLTSPQGQQVLVNTIRKNGRSVNQIITDV